MTSCAVPSFTSGLYLDRDQPDFAAPPFISADGAPTPKLLRLRTPGNEDAVVWSVFRTLLRLDAARWLPALLAGLERPLPTEDGTGIRIELWPSVAANVPDGPTELDAVIRAPGLLLAIDGAMKPLPAARSGVRDRIGRALDAALALADAEGRDGVAFLLLAPKVEQPRTPLVYDALIEQYRDPVQRAALLSHRSAAELARLDGRIVWLTLGHAVQAAAGATSSGADEALVRGLREWLFWQERRAGLR